MVFDVQLKLQRFIFYLAPVKCNIWIAVTMFYSSGYVGSKKEIILNKRAFILDRPSYGVILLLSWKGKFIGRLPTAAGTQACACFLLLALYRDKFLTTQFGIFAISTKYILPGFLVLLQKIHVLALITVIF